MSHCFKYISVQIKFVMDSHINFLLKAFYYFGVYLMGLEVWANKELQPRNG